ncbi:hypothetical protein [Halorussus marinus]|uniref:hypothetical protein n=1 Tax=Halorussus marinus TaxID=2505976 RepID=UPI00143D7A4F|nr:hypothetical protein [Halorussus marinus]
MTDGGVARGHSEPTAAKNYPNGRCRGISKAAGRRCRNSAGHGPTGSLCATHALESSPVTIDSDPETLIREVSETFPARCRAIEHDGDRCTTGCGATDRFCALHETIKVPEVVDQLDAGELDVVLIKNALSAARGSDGRRAMTDGGEETADQLTRLDCPNCEDAVDARYLGTAHTDEHDGHIVGWECTECDTELQEHVDRRGSSFDLEVVGDESSAEAESDETRTDGGLDTRRLRVGPARTVAYGPAGANSGEWALRFTSEDGERVVVRLEEDSMYELWTEVHNVPWPSREDSRHDLQREIVARAERADEEMLRDVLDVLGGEST